MRALLLQQYDTPPRFQLVRRNGPNFYLYDRITRARHSLRTADHQEAQRLWIAQNEAQKQASPTLEVVRTYLLSNTVQMAHRTWAEVMADKEAQYVQRGMASTLDRWRKVCRSAPFRLLASRCLCETVAEHFLEVLRHQRAGNSTNAWLRILHNYALDRGWIYAPILSQSLWPQIHNRVCRGPTEEEHRRLMAMAKDQEERIYYDVLWETGCSPSVVALLTADQIDLAEKTLSYRRHRTDCGFAKLRLGGRLLDLLKVLPKRGFLFPRIVKMSLENRARRFRRLCLSLGIQGVSLHCYRYSWAERARKAGAPLRMAMEVLGHQSRAVRQAYAEN